MCVSCTDVFLGPVCEYVISPVAKYAGVWNIPILTVAAQADGFGHKQPNYPLLTRMMGSYRFVEYKYALIILWPNGVVSLVKKFYDFGFDKKCDRNRTKNLES